MRKSKQNVIKKRLALFCGIAVVAFAGLIFGLGRLSAHAETDLCDGHEYCINIELGDEESGYIGMKINKHTEDRVQLMFSSDGGGDEEYYYSSDTNYYTDEETGNDEAFYYFFSDGKSPEESLKFRPYSVSLNEGNGNSRMFLDDFTAAITLNGKTLTTFDCALEEPDNEYSSVICKIPEGTEQIIPKRGALFGVYHSDEVPEMYNSNNNLDSNEQSSENIDNTNTIDSISMHLVLFSAAAIALVSIVIAACITYKRA